MAPGETRDFAVDVPLSFDAEDEADLDRYRVSVLSRRFAP